MIDLITRLGTAARRGSQDRLPARPEEGPVLICSDPVVKQDRISATDVRDLLVELALTDPGKV